MSISCWVGAVAHPTAAMQTNKKTTDEVFISEYRSNSTIFDNYCQSRLQEVVIKTGVIPSIQLGNPAQSPPEHLHFSQPMILEKFHSYLTVATRTGSPLPSVDADLKGYSSVINKRNCRGVQEESEIPSLTFLFLKPT